MISFTLFFSLLIAALLELFIPILLGLWLWLRLKSQWRVFIIGSVFWFIAYILRTPINNYGILWISTYFSGATLIYLMIIITSLTAGIFEEGARWLAFRLIVKDHKIENGLMYGAGHGGIESILLVGVSVLSTAIISYFYPQMLTSAQLDSITAMSPWVAFIGLWERLSAIVFHIAMSILVLESFRRKQIYYLGVALGAHFFLNFLAVYAVQWGLIQSEFIVSAFAMVSLWYIWSTWKSYQSVSMNSVKTEISEKLVLTMSV